MKSLGDPHSCESQNITTDQVRAAKKALLTITRSHAVGEQTTLEVIGSVLDGLAAVQRAQELQPDLILLDIGLPTLNGIEAARRIREVSPMSKILFVSENRSADIVEEALSTGAGGYVVKSDVERDLLPAVEAVLEGKRFVSASVTGRYNPYLRFCEEPVHF